MLSLRALLPSSLELVPWTDKKGRFDSFRAVAFAPLLLPAVWLLVRAIDPFGLVGLGAEPLTAAIHSTGYWTIWLLVASLAITPFKAVSGIPNVVVIRRMTGNAALLYGLAHIAFYTADQGWNLVQVASEILRRFYLTIGFAALLGLTVLGLTSTDGWIRRLGKRWKQLHRLVYAMVALGLFHYVLQSKLDVSQAMVAGGVFAWLMVWRMLPAGRDRSLLPLLALGLAAALVTLALEYAWYRFGTRIDPMKILRSEFDVGFGLRPAGQVLLLGLVACAVMEVRRLGQTGWASRPWLTVAVYASGAWLPAVVALYTGWTWDDVPIDAGAAILMSWVWAILFAPLGFARWAVRATDARRLIDAVWVASILYRVSILGSDSQQVGAVGAAIMAVAAVGVAAWFAPRSWRAALAIVPLGGVLAVEAAVLFGTL